MAEVSGSAAVVAVSAIAARVSVRHTGGWSWESRWLLVTKYLARLNEIYAGEKINSNTDLWAIVNSFMVDCDGEPTGLTQPYLDKLLAE